MPTKTITHEKILSINTFTIRKIFWNLFRAFIFTQVAHKHRPFSVQLNLDLQF